MSVGVIMATVDDCGREHGNCCRGGWNTKKRTDGVPHSTATIGHGLAKWAWALRTGAGLIIGFRDLSIWHESHFARYLLLRLAVCVQPTEPRFNFIIMCAEVRNWAKVSKQHGSKVNGRGHGDDE